MAAFFGLFAAVLNFATFVLQILGTPRLLRRWGVGFGLRVLPTGFGLGALVLLATAFVPIPMLGAAAVAMLFCDGFRFSVDKASTELLVPADPARREGPGQAVHRHVRRSLRPARSPASCGCS